MSNRLYSRDHTTRYPRPLDADATRSVESEQRLYGIGDTLIIAALMGLLALLLSSCTVEPFMVVTKSGNHITSLGGSVATRSKAKTRSITTAAGDTLTSSGDTDETVVPRQSATAGLIGKGIEAIPSIARSVAR